jgi:hypothetical protein
VIKRDGNKYSFSLTVKNIFMCIWLISYGMYDINSVWSNLQLFNVDEVIYTVVCWQLTADYYML